MYGIGTAQARHISPSLRSLPPSGPYVPKNYTRKRRVRDLTTLRAVGSSARQSAMHERYPGLNLFNSRHTAQLDRRCPRITPPTRHLTRADLARRSATILASEPPPEVIIGLVTSFQRLRSTSGVPKAPRPQLYGRTTQEPLPGAQNHLHVPFQGT